MFQTDDPPAQKSISSVQTFAPHTSKDQDTARMRTQCSLRVRSVEEASELPGIIKSHLERSAPIHARVKAMALHELSKAAHGINFHGENEQLLDANVLVRRSTGLSISLRMPWWLKTYIIHFGLAQGPFGAMNWGLQIHCQNIIPESSPVFRACAAADVVEVRRLFLDAKASPFDVDLMGRSLLHYAIRERLNEGKEIGEQTVMVVRFLIHCGTGAASGLSPIVQSHSLLSEDYRMAASLIAGEIKTARSFGNNHLAYGAYWLEQSDRLCGPDPYIDILKSMDPETLANTAYASTFKSELVEDVNTINNLNAIARLCINTAGSDPFESTNLCWELWRQLGCNEPALPLDLPLLHQHQWPVLETLLESNASQLLYDLMTVNCCNSMFSILDDMYARNLEQKYRVMQVLSSGGMLQREYIPDLPLNTADTCDSDYNPLIRMFLSEASKTSCCKRRQRSMFRKYCHEMLRLLLEVEEHPRVLLTDSELLEINRITTTRSLTCIAAEGGLLDVWNSALVDAGKDGNGIVDEWLFSDFSLLFEEESIVNGPTYLEREWHCSRCESVARGGMQDSWSGAIDDNTNKNEGMTTLGRMTQLGWTVLSTARYFV